MLLYIWLESGCCYIFGWRVGDAIYLVGEWVMLYIWLVSGAE